MLKQSNPLRGKESITQYWNIYISNMQTSMHKHSWYYQFSLYCPNPNLIQCFIKKWNSFDFAKKTHYYSPILSFLQYMLPFIYQQSYRKEFWRKWTINIRYIIDILMIMFRLFLAFGKWQTFVSIRICVRLRMYLHNVKRYDVIAMCQKKKRNDTKYVHAC